MALFVSQLANLAVPRQFFALMEVSPPFLRDVTSEPVRDRDAALRRLVSGRKRDPERLVCKAAHAPGFAHCDGRNLIFFPFNGSE